MRIVVPSPSSPPGCASPSDRTALFAAEPRFAQIEERAGPLPWRSRPRGFAGLLRTICGQQISNQAAGAIWRRLSALPGALTPEGLLAMDDATLCGTAGLSRPKAAHARSLATACLDGTLDFDRMASLPDAEAVAMLSAVRGLGPWTAEVHLIFAEGRADIFPSGDIALANSARHLFALEARPAPKPLARMAEAWSPARSLAARLLWHHWRHETGRPLIEDP
ncbi:DNA-3-methyladenine glycosylase family protein [Sediminicoccus rosea]|jgi:DNA-3-methyladenine glycosylase II|uniref:DNA-3-methyladenine glycosylase II n=1 Tax=Sediminicoccus rosea TaxID=1225128 RepID=A0ABZ0PIU8_9PROT|nr:DNA-3-methyladenine glycosylase 2 family protein [Sediminicoccus rosea]WPB85060.1 DNA-3-methyladenine glycosylase 2 family protein [Sediminicoccus rosea]